MLKAVYERPRRRPDAALAGAQNGPSRAEVPAAGRADAGDDGYETAVPRRAARAV